jgi:hypothetical protein
MAKVFISYRRDDTTGHAGRMYDRLVERFGEEGVFLDVDTIPPGEDFATYIGHALHDCDICIVAIGPNWRIERLRNPDDFVRQEILACLERGVRLVPALFDGARMPAAADLPSNLQHFSNCQAYDFGIGRDFRAQVARLLTDIDRAITEADARRRVEERDALRRIAMRPHQYPIWVLVLGGLVLLSALASVSWVPKYARAVATLWQADAAYQRGDSSGSARQYAQVLDQVPTSKDAKIGLALSLFSLGSPDGAKQAMDVLAGITISRSDRDRLRSVMPREYQKKLIKESEGK